MRIKGVGPLEQNADKIVLGVVGVIFFLVVATQFLAGPSKVTDGSEEKTLNSAYMGLKDDATRVIAQMDNPAAAPESPAPQIGSIWSSSVGSEQATGEMFAFGERRGPGVVDGGSDIPIDDIPFDENAISAHTVDTYQPDPPLVSLHRATMHPAEVKFSPPLQAAMAEIDPEFEIQPMDFGAITVEFDIDGSLIRELLLTPPPPVRGEDGEIVKGFNRLNSEWFDNNRFAILRIEIEREGFDVNGSPQGIQRIGLVPGRREIVPPLAEDQTLAPEEQSERIRNAVQREEEILRPVFPATIAGAAWLPPSVKASIDRISEQEGLIQANIRAREQAREQIERLEERIEDEQDRDSDRGNPNPGDRGPGRRPQPSRDNDNPRIEGFRQQIAELEDQIEEINRTLSAIGVDENGVPLPPVVEFDDDVALLDDTSRTAWAHDLLVTPGMSYSYRVRLVFNNPLFNRALDANLVTEDDRAIATRPEITSAWSGWSSPLVVEPDEIMLVTSANTGDDPRARVQAFKFFYGFWRSVSETRARSESLGPGDSLVSEVQLPEDPWLLPIYDLARVQENGDLPEIPVEGEEPASPGVSAGPSELMLEFDRVMLDVEEIGGAARVFFATPDGRLVTERVVRRDNALLARLWASAELGLRQGVVVNEVPDPGRPDRDQPNPERNPRDRPGPGGG